MSQILLRRAAQIVNRINRETAIEVEQDNDEDYPYRSRRKRKVPALSASITVNIDGNPTQRISDARTKLLSDIDKMFRLMRISTELRQQAAAKQTACGISALVTERVMIVRQQQVLERLLAQVAGNKAFDEQEFETQANAMRTRLANATQGQTIAEITTVVLTASSRATLEQNLTAVKRRMLDIDDKLAELNSTNSITIKDEDEQYLRQIGIA